MLNRRNLLVAAATICAIFVAWSMVLLSSDARNAEVTSAATRRQVIADDFKERVRVESGTIASEHQRHRSLVPLPHPSDDGGEPSDSPVRDAEASKLRRFEELQQHLSAHEREPMDAEWSRTFGEAVSANLNLLSERQGFETREVSCRSATCIATIVWPTGTDAVNNWKQVLHGSGQVPCSRSILLPDFADPDAPLEHYVIYSRCADRVGAE